MKLLGKAAVAGIGAALAGWIAWGIYATSKAKSVPYEQLGTVNGVELRQYPKTLCIETTAPNQRIAFRRLFEYISGANHYTESISMTAPVATQRGESIPMTALVRSASNDNENAVRMTFYLPPEYRP